MRCPNCNKRIPDDEELCPKCGAVVYNYKKQSTTQSSSYKEPGTKTIYKKTSSYNTHSSKSTSYKTTLSSSNATSNLTSFFDEQINNLSSKLNANLSSNPKTTNFTTKSTIKNQNQNNLEVKAKSFGIAGFTFSVFALLSVSNILFGILAIIFSCISISKSKNLETKPVFFAKLGLILGILSLIINIVLFITFYFLY